MNIRKREARRTKWSVGCVNTEARHHTVHDESEHQADEGNVVQLTNPNHQPKQPRRVGVHGSIPVEHNTLGGDHAHDHVHSHHLFSGGTTNFNSILFGAELLSI